MPLQHVRVMWIQNPAEEAVIAWTTALPGHIHKIYYDTVPHGGDLGAYAHQQAALPSRRYAMTAVEAGTPEGWAQAVSLKKLTPATRYYFVVMSDDLVSREFHFITAPVDERRIRCLSGGDSRPRVPSVGTPHLVRRQMNRMIARLVEDDPEIIALAHGGDYDTLSEWRYMRDWLSDYELTTTPAGRLLPIIPARGNHEWKRGTTFDDVFFSPDLATPFYYCTRLSARVVLVTLNTQESKGGDQRDWLEMELKRLRSLPKQSIIVQYHIPAYPSVKPMENGGGQRLHWVPLFEKYGVPLVCEGDDHMMKRTVPIYENQENAELGVTYIGDGGLGVPPRDPDLSRWYLQPPGYAIPTHHVYLLECNIGEIKVSAIGIDGAATKEFALPSRDGATP